MAQPILDYDRSQPVARAGALRYIFATIAGMVIFAITFFVVGATIVQRLAPDENNPRFMLLLVADAVVAVGFAATSFLAIVKEWRVVENRP